MKYAFGVIRVCVVALIINTVADMWRKGVKNVRDYIVFVVVMALLFAFDLSAILIVLLASGASFIPNIGSKKP
ncbi:MAG: hypothetical protein IJ778_03355 [Alphaproteobacteria bacterium]|nr:hypothetical protein [Alphaproteobacteria bacterium]